jgi:hypothetical protein
MSATTPRHPCEQRGKLIEPAAMNPRISNPLANCQPTDCRSRDDSRIALGKPRAKSEGSAQKNWDPAPHAHNAEAAADRST